MKNRGVLRLERRVRGFKGSKDQEIMNRTSHNVPSGEIGKACCFGKALVEIFPCGLWERE